MARVVFLSILLLTSAASAETITVEHVRVRAGTSLERPAVEIDELGDRFVISADVPGVDPAAIEITMENGVLSFSGERALPQGRGNGSRRSERVYGTFFRRFTLPDTADEDAIEARGENGVLEITIPKKQQLQPKKIRVNS